MSVDVPDSDPDLKKWQQQLQWYADNIQDCVMRAEWERLADTLDARHVYLEQFFVGATSFSEHKKLLIKQFALSILEQDAVFISYIEEQKMRSASQQSVLDRGRKAMQAYNSY
ncbi:MULTISPECIES: hypothetical protein [Methylomonas]|uniref:Flagellar protein FliT n=2 Tax=Methylomonas TaxID=416 RepID=A0A126T6R8_9GAMM|nr:MULTISPECIES: hypothetical protein [Methylomonas]AMK77771.1 hypothetical protein JT25_015020 [Methylomonas denitrificans]OAI08647.1 hypothetical protein A1342_15910 [Methylomonas methanica]TCV86944.1 hypothetical protein EDE11_103170 [Methylomonas methanica]